MSDPRCGRYDMLGFKVEQFEGLAVADFDAFEERKWSSNRFNLERMKVRAKLDALGRALSAGLGEAVGELSFHTTLDHPHIFNHKAVKHAWVYLDRPASEKAELTRIIDKDLSTKMKVQGMIPAQQSAVIGVGVDFDCACIFYRLHSNALLDRRNFSARLADPVERQQFVGLLSRLDSRFVAGFDEEPAPLPSNVDEVEEFRKDLEAAAGWFSVICRFERDDPAPASAEFAGVCMELMLPLLDLWRFSAWSRTNDRLKLARTLKQEKKQKARKLTGLQPGDEVVITSGLLGGKQGTVADVDLKGRVKIQMGRVTIDMDPKILRKA